MLAWLKRQRSLRKRIRHRMMMNAVLSIAIVLIILLQFVFSGVDYMGIEWTEGTAYELGLRMETIFGAYSDPPYNLEDQLKIFRRLVPDYNFNVDDTFNVMMTVDEEKYSYHEAFDEDHDSDFYDDNFFINDFLIIEAHLWDKMIYTNVEDVPLDEAALSTDENKKRIFLTQKFLSTYEVKNRSGEAIGRVHVTLNPYMVMMLGISLGMIVALSIVVALLMSTLMSYFVSRRLIEPLNVLNRKLDLLSEDDIDQVKTIEITKKRPLVEIEGLVNSTNKIVVKMQDYTDLLNDQKAELAIQNDELVENGLRLERLNDTLKSTNSHLKDIMDNVGQGFLKLTDGLKVHPGYSRECDAIFNQVIHDVRFATLLYPDDQEQVAFVEELINSLLKESPQMIDLYLPLLPTECLINDKVIELAYNISSDNDKRSLIVVLTDITEKRALESQMEKERHVLKMVVNYLLHHNLFVELMKSFEDFMVEGKEKNWSFIGNQEEDNQYLLRQLHTFKGNFGQYDAVDMASAIHYVESKVITALDQGRVAMDVEELEKAYEALQAKLETYVGKDWMSDEELIVLDRSRLELIIKQLNMQLSKQDAERLTPKINELLHVTINELLKPYGIYIEKMADRLEKSIDVFLVEGEEIYVDEKRFQPFVKSLVHLFKNALVRGIEAPDNRLDADKDIMGQIECQVSKEQNNLLIVFKDDGAGIRQEDLPHIFEDQFSTTDTLTIDAGRGVGLPAVKEQVDRLEGEISVKSNLGQGTEFFIKLPLEASETKQNILPSRFMEAIVESSKIYFTELPGEAIKTDGNMEVVDQLELYTTTSMTKISGDINAIVVLTINDKLEQALFKSLITDEIPEEEIRLMNQEILKEVSNTILGNALGALEDYSETLELGIPISLHHESIQVYLEKNEMLSLAVEHEDKACRIYMLDMNHVKL